MKSKLFVFGMALIGWLGFSDNNAQAQGITAGGQIGWASPKGGSFVDGNGEKMAGGGLAIDVDVLYHFEKYDYKLAAGITYNTSILLGISDGDNLNVGLYGLSLYGLKGMYRFSRGSVTPYVSLSTGLSQFGTPEISDGTGEVLQEAENSFSLGLKPEVGVDLGGFILSAGYVVPMKYSITDRSAGALQISLGYRYKSF